jgi:hypothetical protein
MTDARLMAAAPELLAALRLFAALPEDAPPPGVMPSAWKAALAAARKAIQTAGGAA